MTQTKHTQGPWRPSLTEGQRAWNVSSEATGRTVAIVSDWSPEAEANARLIAAASSMPHYCTDPECKGGNLMRELEHLTPGGSEYVGDVERCIEAIKRSRETELGIRKVLGEKLHAATAQRKELLEALEDLLGDLPSIQGGICQHCGRDYMGGEDEILSGDCPSDDCPSFKARAAIAKAEGGAQ